MALVPPKVVQTLLTGDSTTSRALQSIKGAVDPLLGLVNTTFQVANDGSLAFLRRIKTFTATAVSATTVTATAVNATTVTATTVSATSNVVSPTGFKSTQDMGIVWFSSAVAATRYQAKRFAQNNDASSTFNCLTLFQPLYAGSIIGVHGYSQGTAGGNFQMQLYKSTTQVSSSSTIFLQTTAAGAGQYYGQSFAYAKGKYPFAVGDYFSAGATFDTAGNQFITITLVVEYAA